MFIHLLVLSLFLSLCQAMDSSQTLSKYGVSEVTGFMPAALPNKRLPSYYEPWETIIDQLPQLIRSGEIEGRVRELPQLSVSDDHLPTEADRWRAYVVATFIGQGYVWRNMSDPRHVVPAKLAVPWVEIAKRVDMPPVVTYSTACLYNWGLRDPSGPLNGDNMYSLITYTGLPDESWFYVVSLLVEAAAVPALKAVVDAYASINVSDNRALLENMEEMKRTLKNMANALKEMTKERCNPEKFYGQIRQFQKGSSDDLLKGWNGLLFEGASETPLQHCGASAAQSSTLPVFDVFLGVNHSGGILEFLTQQRLHMPPLHREFIAYLQQQPSAREYITLQSCDDRDRLTQCYNEIAETLREFRRNHYALVYKYILKQIPKTKATVTIKEPEQKRDEMNNAAKGTGGTSLKDFLNGVRNDISNLRMDSCITEHTEL